MTSKRYAHIKEKNKRISFDKWNEHYSKEFGIEPNDTARKYFNTIYNMGHKNGRKEKRNRHFKMIREGLIKLLG